MDNYIKMSFQISVKVQRMNIIQHFWVITFLKYYAFLFYGNILAYFSFRNLAHDQSDFTSLKAHIENEKSFTRNVLIQLHITGLS